MKGKPNAQENDVPGAIQGFLEALEKPPEKIEKARVEAAKEALKKLLEDYRNKGLSDEVAIREAMKIFHSLFPETPAAPADPAD